METKQKFKPNEWLENESFMSKIDFHNKYYIESLGKVLASYIKTVPIPVLTTWDPVNKRIYFHVGQEKRFFEVDENINYWDYTYLVHKWLYQFFPRFEVEEEQEVELSEEEIFEKVKEGMNLNDALLLRKKAIVKDVGVITKIHITNDEFVLNRNGFETIRISGSLENPLPLSSFLKQFRSLTDNKEKRDFILKNSKEIKELPEEKKQIIIDYPSQMMKNFFTIRYDDLKKMNITKIYDNVYEMGRFKLVFESSDLARDCFRYLKQKKLEEGIEVD
ncbi:MAG TPA: hypothetical protein PKW14_11625 [Bacteroidota bacterium]|nr:hypothetical protein [Bacteroidota bacterium]